MSGASEAMELSSADTKSDSHIIYFIPTFELKIVRVKREYTFLILWYAYQNIIETIWSSLFFFSRSAVDFLLCLGLLTQFVAFFQAVRQTSLHLTLEHFGLQRSS
ncbi:hypothetical protein AMECASPLE_039282 [Ameca splendens]|uniref:Uncharacterized protein n=1 Tax=Ameca splendens TaxID=208324 RepID=A0ABV0Y945_9TELE